MKKQTALLQNRKTARLLYWLCFVCLMLAAGVLLFGRLSAARLEDYDELRHGQNAYEMLQSGDYIVHTYHGEADYYNCKPPLGLWIITLGYRLFGYNLLGLRFFSALSLWLMIGILGLWLRRYGSLTSLLSMGAMIATKAVYLYHYARYGELDAFFQLFFTLSMLCMLESRRNARFHYGGAFFFALAFMTKSYHAALIPLIYLLYLLLTGRGREITPKRVLLLLAVAAAVILPWAVLRWQRDGFTFLKAMFQTDVAQRAGLSAEELGTDFYWYLYIEYLFQQPMFAGAMILCAVSGPLLAGNGRLRREEKADLTGLLLWLIVPVLFFSLIPFKLRWYVYASLTAGAALLGWTVQQLANHFGGKSWKALACLGVSVALIAVCSLDCLSYVRNLNYRQNYQQMMINALHRETDAGVHAYVQYGETADGVHVTRWQDGDRFIAELYGALVCEDGGAAAFEADEGRAVLLIGAGGQEALTERLSAAFGPALEKGGVMLFTKEAALP